MPAFRRLVLAPALLVGLIVAGGVAPAAALADTSTDPVVAGPTVPDAPTSVVATAGDGTISLSWAPPAFTGGSDLLDYVVTATPKPADPATPAPAAVTAAAATALPVTVNVGAPAPASVDISPLVDRVTYDLTVVARNSTGAGPGATTSATPRTVPGAAAVTTVTPGDGLATVAWTPPADDGGAPVTGYLVTAHPSGVAVTVHATTASVALPNGLPGTVSIAPVNGAGAGPAVTTAAVTPRKPGRLGVVLLPASTVVYGSASKVTASLLSTTGAYLPGRRVELLSRIGTGAWRTAAAGTTGSTGRVILSTVLPATASLSLRHPLGEVAASTISVRLVHVARRVSTGRHVGIRTGQAVVTTGGVAPARAIGSRVVLQRHTASGWVTAAYGKMTTRTAYRVLWTPRSAGTQSLRVLVPADASYAAGTGAAWRQAVTAETVATIANDILHESTVTLATVHESGVRDSATARGDMLALAAGHLAPRSAYQNAPGGSTSVTIGLMRAIRALGQHARITVSEIAGGSHAVGSAHYRGHAVDITVVNGVSISGGGNYSLVASICRSNGAGVVYDPAYDPYGGHSNHVHCEW